MRFILLVSFSVLVMSGCQFEKVRPGNLPLISSTGPSVDDDGCLLKCEAVGKSCGEIDNNCGAVLKCSECASDEVCGGSGEENVCCTPATCEELGADCGSLSDTCGSTVDCGTCSGGDNCGGGGPNLCGDDICVPTTCDSLGLDCGSINDGCGAIEDCGTCSGNETCGGASSPNVCGEANVVIPDDLVTKCFGWPDTEFSPQNKTSVRISLQAGNDAVDFTLKDLNGTEFTLSELLLTKPVFMQFGSYTCPVYQRNISTSNPLVDDYGSQVHFIEIYTMEAHPMGDPSPYRGSLWEREYSDYAQATNYAERVTAASALTGLHANKIVLVDEFNGENVNPIWCTYGPAPNAGFLIAQDGTIAAAQAWLEEGSMRTAIEALLQ